MSKVKGLEKNEKKSELILGNSLQGYFFDELTEINQKSNRPLPNETLYYSSLVMDKF